MSATTVESGTEPGSNVNAKPLPPVLGRLLSGTFWLALRTPLTALFAFWSVPLITGTFGEDLWAAFNFAWSFGFLQFLLEFGMSSALQRQVSECWTKGDREGVHRAITCGVSFYAFVAVIQASVLLAVAHLAEPFTDFKGPSYRFIVQLLWLQAMTAPTYGLSVVASSILQAARRFDILPRFELLIVCLRFALLWVGIKVGWSYLAITIAQVLVQIGLSLGPAVWVMVRELDFVPRLQRVRLADFRVLMQVSLYLFFIQLSVVLADKVDTSILGFVLADPEKAVAEYSYVSRPFLQIRQTGWVLAYLVLPAVASLAAAKDERALDRVKYDGPRLHIGVLLPIGLLAWVYAGPFLDLWVGKPELAWLLRLFLVATIPLMVSVHVQACIGMGRVAFIALSALGGAVVNLPLSYLLTLRLGVSGVIWGTVLTTLISNLILPGIHAFRVLGLKSSSVLRRTLSAPLAGGVALVAGVWAFQAILPAEPDSAGGMLERSLPLLANLSIGCLAYMIGYLAVPVGRGDLVELWTKFRRRGQTD